MIHQGIRHGSRGGVPDFRYLPRDAETQNQFLRRFFLKRHEVEITFPGLPVDVTDVRVFRGLREIGSEGIFLENRLERFARDHATFPNLALSRTGCCGP